MRKIMSGEAQGPIPFNELAEDQMIYQWVTLALSNSREIHNMNTIEVDLDLLYQSGCKLLTEFDKSESDYHFFVFNYGCAKIGDRVMPKNQGTSIGAVSPIPATSIVEWFLRAGLDMSTDKVEEFKQWMSTSEIVDYRDWMMEHLRSREMGEINSHMAEDGISYEDGDSALCNFRPVIKKDGKTHNMIETIPCGRGSVPGIAPGGAFLVIAIGELWALAKQLCSTSLSSGNQVDGSPLASHNA